MSLIDIKAVEDAANAEIAAERTKAAKDALVRQMRVVAAAEQVVISVKLKLADIKAQIADGTL